jgi:hypothetical protein
MPARFEVGPEAGIVTPERAIIHPAVSSAAASKESRFVVLVGLAAQAACASTFVCGLASMPFRSMDS